VTDRPARSRPAGQAVPTDPTVSAAPPASADSDDDSADSGPLTLRLAVLLLWIQSVCVGILAVAEIVGLIRNGTDRFEWAAWVIAGPIVASVGLWVAGRLLIYRRVAGRGLAVALQLCAVPAVFFMVTGHNDLWVRAVGVVVGVSVLTCIGLVVAPPSRRALFGS
jgi:hypothetical protein